MDVRESSQEKDVFMKDMKLLLVLRSNVHRDEEYTQSLSFSLSRRMASPSLHQVILHQIAFSKILKELIVPYSMEQGALIISKNMLTGLHSLLLPSSTRLKAYQAEDRHKRSLKDKASTSCDTYRESDLEKIFFPTYDTKNADKFCRDPEFWSILKQCWNVFDGKEWLRCRLYLKRGVEYS